MITKSSLYPAFFFVVVSISNGLVEGAGEGTAYIQVVDFHENVQPNQIVGE